MQAVLYIGHGSRLEAGVEEAIQFIEGTAITAQYIEEICFLELAKPTIEDGIENCIARGATKIAVVPLLLLSAVHAKEDIPKKIAAGRQMYPHITFTYGRAFGIDDKIVDALYDRIMEQKIPLTEYTQVLLVGRGSSDLDVKYDLTEIARRLESKYQLVNVDTCFLYGATPCFEDVLSQYEREKPKQVFIVPYLLFMGLLMQDIERMVKDVSHGNLVLCKSLGYHKNLQQVLTDRVNELLLTSESIL